MSVVRGLHLSRIITCIILSASFISIPFLVANAQSLVTVTTQVPSTVDYTSPATTASENSTSTIVSKAGTLDFRCDWKYWDVNAKAGQVISAQITSTQPIYVYIMTGQQVNAFQTAATCQPAAAGGALLLQDAATSHQILWSVPADGTYYFIFYDLNPNNPVYSNLYIYSVQSGQTVVYTTGQTVIAVETETVSTVSTPLVVPSTSSWILVVVALVIVGLIVSILYLRRGGKTESTKAEQVDSKTKKTTSDKNFCIECGKELSLKSKFCNNCGTKQP